MPTLKINPISEPIDPPQFNSASEPSGPSTLEETADPVPVPVDDQQEAGGDGKKRPKPPQ